MKIENYPAREVIKIARGVAEYYGDNWKDKAQRWGCIQYVLGAMDVEKGKV
jgi:hypothetical protein